MFTDKNGRKITPDQFAASLKKAVMKQAEIGINEIKRKEASKLARQYGLSGAVCPEHKCGPQNIRLEPERPGSERHYLAYDECCPQLVGEVERRAQSHGL